MFYAVLTNWLCLTHPKTEKNSETQKTKTQKSSGQQHAKCWSGRIHPRNQWPRLHHPSPTGPGCGPRFQGGVPCLTAMPILRQLLHGWKVATVHAGCGHLVTSLYKGLMMLMMLMAGKIPLIIPLMRYWCWDIFWDLMPLTTHSWECFHDIPTGWGPQSSSRSVAL